MCLYPQYSFDLGSDLTHEFGDLYSYYQTLHQAHMINKTYKVEEIEMRHISADMIMEHCKIMRNI